LGGFALSGLAAGSAAFNATATAAINVGLINAGFGLTTQLIFNEGNSSNLDYGSLALDFGFGTLGSFVGAGVAAKTGGGLVSRIGFSTAFEGAFAGTEQVVRNLANGGSWSQDVRSAILSSIIFQGGSEILSNGREILLAGGRLLRAGDNLADDLLGAFGGRQLALEGVGNGPLPRNVDVSVNKGGDRFAASTSGSGSSNSNVPSNGASRGAASSGTSNNGAGGSSGNITSDGANSSLSNVNNNAWVTKRITSFDGRWKELPGGVMIKKNGNFWIKKVNPNASFLAQKFGKGSLDAQAQALNKLGDMSPSFLYKNDKLIIRDAGEYNPNDGNFWEIWLEGSKRLKTPFNDIRPRNIGANRIIFDPAKHPIQQTVEGIGSIAIPTLTGYIIYDNLKNDD